MFSFLFYLCTHFEDFHEKKTRGFFYKTRIMAKLIEKVIKGGSLKTLSIRNTSCRELRLDSSRIRTSIKVYKEINQRFIH